MFGKKRVETLVVGAGPCGMITALALADGGNDVMIVDSAPRTCTASNATILHPETLVTLRRLGIADRVGQLLALGDDLLGLDLGRRKFRLGRPDPLAQFGDPLAGGFEPVLSGLPPLDSLGADGPRSGNAAVREALQAGEFQHLAWRRVGEKGQRGFGFTGGHFHHNWNDDAFRKLVLNGIAWTAGLELPESGIVSDFPNIVTYKTIDEAIARDVLSDVRVQLSVDPHLLNTPGRGNMTPLQQAVMRKKSEIALYLLEQGADPNAKTGSGQTTAHLAVTRGLPELCRALAEAGVDLGARDKQGWTALHLAAAKNQPDTVRVLIEVGADVNALSDAGGTPLHEAAASGGPDVVRLLLEAGVDTSVVSAHGVTALDLAKEYQNAVAVELLQ